MDDNYKFINLSRFFKKRMKMDGLKKEKRVRKGGSRESKGEKKVIRSKKEG